MQKDAARSVFSYHFFCREHPRFGYLNCRPFLPHSVADVIAMQSDSHTCRVKAEKSH